MTFQGDIENIKKLLSTNTRDLLLFTLGINNGLRCGDLLKLKVSDIKDLKPGDTLTIREQKTGKDNILMVNKTTHKILKQFLGETKSGDDQYLFKSRKGNTPLSVGSVNAIVKDWCRAINLKGNLRDAFPAKNLWVYSAEKIRRGLGDTLQALQSFIAGSDHEVSRD